MIKVVKQKFNNLNKGAQSKLPRLTIWQDIKVNPKIKGYESLNELNNRSSLPHKMLESYEIEEIKDALLDVIIMENDYLIVQILPSYGARVIRLYDKKIKKDLVFHNQNYKLMNIALTNAWFAGGIEFNIGRLGHHPDTNLDIGYRIKDDKVIFENYARREMIYYGFQFSLVEDVFKVDVKIQNEKEGKNSLYWWTNTAVKAKEIDCISKKALIRVDNGIFKDFDLNERKDYLDPNNIKNSEEYFFDAREYEYPYESLKLDDKYSLYEMSTKELCFKKMFCWGTLIGGENWNDNLVGKDNRYIEIQAGLAPTQMHSLPFENEINFTQVFSSNFKKAKEVVKNREEVELLKNNPFYNLDRYIKGDKEVNKSEELSFFYNLIDKGEIKEVSLDNIIYHTNIDLIKYLDKVDNSYLAHVYKCIIFNENMMVNKAKEEIKKALSLKENLLTLYLSSILSDDIDEKINLINKAKNDKDYKECISYHARLLVQKKDIEALRELFEKNHYRSDFLQISYIEYLILIGDKKEARKALLDRSWTNILEGDNILDRLYTKITGSKDIPKSIDFRMNE